MTNKLKLSYLTLLVVLTGALVLGSGIVGLASTATYDLSPVYVKAGATDVLMVEFDVADNSDDGTSESLSGITVETSNAHGDIDTVYVLDSTKTQIASQALDSTSMSISVSDTIPAGGTNTYYLAMDVSSTVSDSDTVSLKATGVTGTGLNTGLTGNASGSATADTLAPVYDSAITGKLSGGDSTARKKVRLSFTESGAGLDATTVEPGDFSVTGATVESVDSNDNYVVLTLASELATGANPDVGLTGTVKDNAGNSAATATKTADDGLIPEMSSAISTSTTTIKVTFSEELSTVLGSSYFTWDGSGSVDSVKKLSTGVYSLTLDGAISTGATDNVNLDTNVQDAVGNTLDQSGVSVTSDDGLAPTFNSANATSTTNINANFSEDLDSTTISAADFSVEGYTVEEAALSSTPGSTVALTIASKMPTDATPKTTLVSSESVADTSGNALSGEKLNFATDSISPVLEEIIWFDEDSSGAVNPGDKLKFRFSEPMTTSTVAAGNIDSHLEPNSGNDYGDSPTVTWAQDKRSVTVTLASETGTLVTSSLQVNPTSVTDDAVTGANSDATPYLVGLQEVSLITLVKSDGTTDSYTNITQAEAGASSGETIVVPGDYEGTYSSYPVTVDVSDLTIKAAEGATPVLDVDSSNGFAIHASGVTIDGLTLENSGGSGVTLINLNHSNATGFVLTDSTLDLTQNSKDDTGIAVANSSVTATVNGSTIEVDVGGGNGSGVANSGEQAITVSAAGTLTMQKSSTITGSSGVGIYVNSDATLNLYDSEVKGTEYGLYIDNAGAVVTVERTVFKNGTWDSSNSDGAAVKSAVDISGDGGSLEIYGSAITSNAGYGLCTYDGGTDITLRYNNFVNNNSSGNADSGVDNDKNGASATLTADYNWWGQATGPADSQITNTTASSYLGAAVNAADFKTGADTLDAESTVGAYIDSETSHSTDLVLAKYDSSPTTAQATDAVNYFAAHDFGTKDNPTTLRFYTNNENNKVVFWDGSDWAVPSDTSYYSGYIEVTLTPSKVPTESILSGGAQFALVGAPAGSSGRSLDVVQGWQMIGLGFSPDDPAPAAVFGNNVGAVFEWDPTAGTAGKYVNGTDLSAVSYADGFWYYSSSSATIDLGNGADVEADVTIEFAAGDGSWLMFSVPFNVNWSQVRFGDTYSGGVAPDQAQEDGLILNNVKTYNTDYDPTDPASKAYKSVAYEDDGSNVGLLQADKAYWIRVDEASADLPVKMQVPYDPSAPPSTSAAKLASIAAAAPESTATPPAPPAAPQAVAGELKATAAMSNGSVTFEVAGADVSSINVQVFNVNGEEIFSDSASGNSLSWNAEVANGLYLYGVSAKVNGQVKPLGIQKLLVLQ